MKREKLGGSYVRFQIDKIINQLAINMKGLTKKEEELYKRIMQDL